MTPNHESVSPEFSSGLSDETSGDTSISGASLESLRGLARAHGLLEYQEQFACDPARFKIGLWARQTGKDHTCAFEAVWDSIVRPRSFWIILAASERQALESLAKAKEWAQALDLEISGCTEERGSARSGRARASSGARLRSAEIQWANGSRLLALPANPNTVRGYSANLILTEFAFHEDPDQIWRAIYPSISNPLKGGAKKRRIISTPNGPSNKFAQLWRESKNSGSEIYARSFINIHDAIAAGLPLDAEQLRLGLNDDEAWNQEYLCEFTDTLSVLLPYDLLESCESPEATEFPESLACSLSRFNNASEVFAGIDFGRKQHLTVCWIFERLNQKLVTREVLTLQNMSTPAQLEILRPRLKRCHKACIDYTGAGVGLGDYLAKEFGQWIPNAATAHPAPSFAPSRSGKVELCQFTSGLKAELFPRLRAAFENRELLIPSSPAIREDLHALHRIVSPNGQITYRARSTPDGHSDRCTALALALRAAAQARTSYAPATVVRRRARSAC